MSKAILFWRRLDFPGLERLELEPQLGGVVATSTVIALEGKGFRIDHNWQLDEGWRPVSVSVERRDDTGASAVRVERCDNGWRVDGCNRPDLDGAEEPDLSVTPFCNSFAIRRVPVRTGARLALDTAYIDGTTLTVVRSRQGYVRHGAGQLRYIDLGAFPGFEADILVDDQGIVLRYGELFERIYSASGHT